MKEPTRYIVVFVFHHGGNGKFDDFIDGIDGGVLGDGVGAARGGLIGEDGMPNDSAFRTVLYGECGQAG